MQYRPPEQAVGQSLSTHSAICSKRSSLSNLVHDESVWLIDAADAAVQGRADDPSAGLRRTNAERVSLKRVDAHDVMHAVPFDSPERLEDRSAGLPRPNDVLREQILEPDFALVADGRVIYRISGGIRPQNRRSGAGS